MEARTDDGFRSGADYCPPYSVFTKVWTIRVACKLSFQGTLYFSASFAYAWNFEKNPALQRCPIASQ